MASRGETSGPRVEEAKTALSYWRCHSTLFGEVERGNIAESTANEALDILTRRR